MLDGAFSISYVPTDQMLADGLTKPLPGPLFERFKRQLGLTMLGARGLGRRQDFVGFRTRDFSIYTFRLSISFSFYFLLWNSLGFYCREHSCNAFVVLSKLEVRLAVSPQPFLSYTLHTSSAECSGDTHIHD